MVYERRKNCKLCRNTGLQPLLVTVNQPLGKGRWRTLTLETAGQQRKCVCVGGEPIGTAVSIAEGPYRKRHK